ncbi:MAG TPA: substrate-binding domain-containing protein [Clostridiales bacterium]|nr:substrate-binding domain-containing protein [Clostridiales bacterium]
MKKVFGLMIVIALLVGTLTACGSSGDQGEDGSSLGAVNVISREDGSGTRGAFVELLGIVDADENDAITAAAEITNSTSVMISTVAGNPNAIGYISLGSLSDDVKAVSIDGVAPTVEDINNGTYTIARPFNIVYPEGSLSDLAEDFKTFILSDEGQTIINDEGYIRIGEGESYTASGLSGTITLAGSTSVSPVMEVLADAYKEQNPAVTIEIQQTGSSAGITSASEGVCNFGMSSRELKDSEASQLTSVSIARDGIVVIVNHENEITNLTSEQVKNIYLGEITDWSELAE